MKNYTCSDYRREMMLAALRKRLAEEALSDKDRAEIKVQIFNLETEIGLH